MEKITFTSCKALTKSKNVIQTPKVIQAVYDKKVTEIKHFKSCLESLRLEIS